MSNSTRVCAVGLAFAAVASGCSAKTEKSASETYHSRTYQYTITYPVGWSAIPADHVLPADGPPLTGGGGTDIIGEDASKRVSKMELPALVIGAQELAGQTTLDDWKTAVTRIVAEQKGCPQPRSSESVNVGGESAVMLRYPDCPKGSGLYHLWTAVVHNGRGFHVVWFGRSENETKERPLLDEVLASLSFTN